MALGKDLILSADDLARKEVDVPEWGGTVFVRALSGEERDAYESSLSLRLEDGTIVPDLANYHAKLAVRGLCDESGARLLSNDDVEVLGRKNAAALGRVADAISDLSGLGEAAAKAAKGNSGAAPSGGESSE